MASRQSTVDYLLEQMAKADQVSARKMFGEYGIYCDSKIVALVCDDQLYVKITRGGEDFLGLAEKESPKASPYPGAKPCFLISGEKWENSDWLAELIKISAAELPVVIKKPSRKKS